MIFTMKRCALFATLSLAMMSLSAGTLGAADDAEAVCTVADFQGTYAYPGTELNVRSRQPVTYAGSLTAGGTGKITAWKDSSATPEAVPAPPALKAVKPLCDVFEKTKQSTSAMPGRSTY